LVISIVILQAEQYFSGVQYNVIANKVKRKKGEEKSRECNNERAVVR
jgi:hypothetical protein